MLYSIENLPDSSRIWVFPADRKLTSVESVELLANLDAYLENWKAHGAPVRAARQLRYDQFLIIAADPDITAPSGCSIDDMTRAFKAFGAKFGVDFFVAMKVFYKEGDSIRVTDRAGFKSLADSETIVFDNSITSLAEYRNGKWELPASESWHQSLFPIMA